MQDEAQILNKVKDKRKFSMGKTCIGMCYTGCFLVLVCCIQDRY